MPKSRQVVGSKKAEKSVESGRRESTPFVSCGMYY